MPTILLVLRGQEIACLPLYMDGLRAACKSASFLHLKKKLGVIFWPAFGVSPLLPSCMYRLTSENVMLSCSLAYWSAWQTATPSLAS